MGSSAASADLASDLHAEHTASFMHSTMGRMCFRGRRPLPVPVTARHSQSSVVNIFTKLTSPFAMNSTGMALAMKPTWTFKVVENWEAFHEGRDMAAATPS